MTDEHHTAPRLIDLRGALDKLPALPLPEPSAGAERLAAMGTDQGAPV